MCRAPGAECRRCLVARIDVDENGAPGVKRDREPEREVAPEVPGRSPVDPLGQERVLDAERLEGGHLLRLGREPRQAGMIKHIVEREQAPHQHFRGGDPARVDSAHSTDAVDAGRILFDGHALRDEGRGRRGAPFRGGNPESSSTEPE